MTMTPPVPGMQGPKPQADVVSWAYIDLTLQGSGLSARKWKPPRVLVNGWMVPASYGLSTVPVPAGQCRVDLVSTVNRRRSSLAFAIAPSQRVPVYYAQPAAPYFAGAIGHTAQLRPGWWVIVLACVAAILAPMVAIAVS